MADIPEGDKDLWGSPVVQPDSTLATELALGVCSCFANAIGHDKNSELFGQLLVATRIYIDGVLVKHGINK